MSKKSTFTTTNHYCWMRFGPPRKYAISAVRSGKSQLAAKRAAVSVTTNRRKSGGSGESGMKGIMGATIRQRAQVDNVSFNILEDMVGLAFAFDFYTDDPTASTARIWTTAETAKAFVNDGAFKTWVADSVAVLVTIDVET